MVVRLGWTDYHTLSLIFWFFKSLPFPLRLAQSYETWVHFEINLKFAQTNPSHKRPIQFSVGLPQPAYHWTCWTKWFIVNVKNYHLTSMGTKTYLLEFSTFSRLPSARFSYIEVCWTLSWVIMIHEIQNQMKLSKNDRMNFSCSITQICRAY